MNITLEPGLLTVTNLDYARAADLARPGYRWVSFQAQNGAAVHDYDLNPAKGAGITPGVWGVTYNALNFYRDAETLAKQAVKLGAQHYTMDIEMAAKDTRPTRGLKPVIDGARAGGWTGPVNLNTLGPPVNPQANDYLIDTESFLETGGGIQTQCYANAYDSYAPELGVKYWTRVGVPIDRLNIQISLYPAESDAQYPGRRFDGAKWVDLLQAAGVTRAFSIFMAEAATDADLNALDVLTVPAPPAPTYDVAVNRAAALRHTKDTVDYWRRSGMPEDKLQKQRQTLSWRTLNVTQTAANLDAIKAALDKAGAPKP